jgi:hypothetical protein
LPLCGGGLLAQSGSLLPGNRHGSAAAWARMRIPAFPGGKPPCATAGRHLKAAINSRTPRRLSGAHLAGLECGNSLPLCGSGLLAQSGSLLPGNRQGSNAAWAKICIPAFLGGKPPCAAAGRHLKAAINRRTPRRPSGAHFASQDEKLCGIVRDTCAPSGINGIASILDLVKNACAAMPSLRK